MEKPPIEGKEPLSNPNEQPNEPLKAKTTRKKPSIPQSIAGTASACRTIARAWVNNYPSFTVKFTDARTLGTLADTLIDTMVENDNNDDAKQEKAQGLRAINADINTAVKVLKKYIKAEYPLQNDLGAVYARYGLSISGSGTYELPRDNDERQMAMAKLLNKLNEANNPFTSKAFGLAHWAGLKQAHFDLWQQSSDNKQDKSSSSGSASDQAKRIRRILSKLKAQIRIDFDGEDTNKVLRSFGFLKENQ